MGQFPISILDAEGEISVRPTLMAGIATVVGSTALNPGMKEAYQFLTPALDADSATMDRLGAVIYVLPALPTIIDHADDAFPENVWLNLVRQYRGNPISDRITPFDPSQHPNFLSGVFENIELSPPPITMILERDVPKIARVEWAGYRCFNIWRAHVFAASLLPDRNTEVFYTGLNIYNCQAMEQGSAGKLHLRQSSGMFTAKIPAAVLREKIHFNARCA
jgi:hypothetical protein